MKILRNVVLFIIIILIVGFIGCADRNHPKKDKADKSIVIGQLDSLFSDILSENRELWIHIPESAKKETGSKTKYPVLYLLDGPSHFKSVTGLISQLSSSNGNMVVPEMIVVGITNTNRTLDLTPSRVDVDFISGDSVPYPSGGGNRFLDFIEIELIPYIERRYPASDYRTFVGHSFGGLTVINSLAERPLLFKNHIAIDPSLWWDDRAFMNQVDSLITNTKFENRTLYVGVANTMESGMDIQRVRSDSVPDSYSTVQIKSILQFVESLEAKNIVGLSFKWKYYPEDDHGSVPLITEYDALRYIFSWYKLDGVNDFFSSKSDITATELSKLIRTHYQKVSENFGYQIKPPEEFINSLGYAFINNEMLDKASAMFDMNIKNYPNASNVYDSKGDCLLAQNDSLGALTYFKKALDVGENDFSQEKINMLQDKLNIK